MFLQNTKERTHGRLQKDPCAMIATRNSNNVLRHGKILLGLLLVEPLVEILGEIRALIQRLDQHLKSVKQSELIVHQCSLHLPITSRASAHNTKQTRHTCCV